MRKLPWFRVYHEARTDAKLRLLADCEHRVWFGLLCLASEQDERGVILAGEDRYPLAVEVATGDLEVLEMTIAHLVKLRILADDGERLTFLHFGDRQYEKPSDRPERIAERVTRHRKGVSPSRETPLKRPETPLSVSRYQITDTERELTLPTEECAPSARVAPAAAPAPAPEPLKIVASEPKAKAAPKPNKLGDVVDAIKAAGGEVTTSARDGKAVKDCSAPAQLIADAYLAASRGEWGDDFTRRNLALWFVCSRIDGYRAQASQARASPENAAARFQGGKYGRLVQS